MELITKNLVVGVAVPAAPPGVSIQGAPEITFDRLNHIFSEIASAFGYRNFQASPDGTQGQIIGASAENAVVVQPGLIQILDAIDLSPEKSAEKAHKVAQTVGKHLGVTQLIQIGIKWLFHVPVSSRDARSFVLEHLTAQPDDELSVLGLGGNQWVGIKYVTQNLANTTLYQLVIEPLQADQSFLFVDVDGSFAAGDHLRLEDVQEKAVEVLDHVRGPVKQFLERLGV